MVPIPGSQRINLCTCTSPRVTCRPSRRDDSRPKLAGCGSTVRICPVSWRALIYLKLARSCRRPTSSPPPQLRCLDFGDRQNQMHQLRVHTSRGAESRFGEHVSHGGVFRQHVSGELFQAPAPYDLHEMLHQKSANALALTGVDHDKGDFGFAGLGHDIASAADDAALAVLADLRDERNMIDEIDVHEERLLLLREAALG